MSQVIAVNIILDHDLPVRGNCVFSAATLVLHQFLDLVGAKAGFHAAEPVLHRGGILVRMDPQHSPPTGHGRPFQPKTRHIQIWKLVFPVGHGKQTAFQTVCPVVVGAGDDLPRIAHGAQQLRPPVTTDIVKRPQLSVLPHNNKDVVQPCLQDTYCPGSLTSSVRPAKAHVRENMHSCSLSNQSWEVYTSTGKMGMVPLLFISRVFLSRG